MPKVIHNSVLVRSPSKIMQDLGKISITGCFCKGKIEFAVFKQFL